MSIDLEDEAATGVTDVVEDIMKLIPDWLNAVQGEKINAAQMRATVSQFDTQIARLKAARAPASAILATRIRLAKEFLPLAERAQRDSEVYLSRSIELDPLISRLARLVSEHPEDYPLVIPIREVVDEAIIEIRALEERERDPRAMSFADLFAPLRHLGRIFQKVYAIVVSGIEFADEGNDIVRRWDAEIKKP